MAIHRTPHGFQIDYWPQGRHGPRIRRTLPTLHDARLELARVRSRTSIHSASDDVPLELCTSEFLAHVAQFRSQNYAKRCRCALNNIATFLAADNVVHVIHLSMRHLDKYFAHRRASLAAVQTVINEYRTLHAALEWARSRRIIATNPIHRYRPPEKAIHNVPDVPTPPQIQAIFNHLPDDDTRRIFYFILAHGSRFSETAALEAANITNGTVTYATNVKANQKRTIRLKQLPFQLPLAGFAFTREGRQWQERCLLSRIQAACTMAQVPKINVHTLRHAAATYALAAGKPVYELMNQCGWKSLAMVSRYASIAIKYEQHKTYLPFWPGSQEKTKQEESTNAKA